MQILKFILKPKLVLSKINNDSDQGEETRTSESPEKPMNECFTAMQALSDVVISVLELPTTYAGKKGEETLRPYGFTLSHTSEGTRSISVLFKKALRNGKTHKGETPLIQIDEPAGSEKEERGLAAGEAATCNQAIAAATLYIAGTRQQQTMDGLMIRRIDPNQEDLGLED